MLACAPSPRMILQSSCPSRDVLTMAVILDMLEEMFRIVPIKVPDIETGNGVCVGITVEKEIEMSSIVICYVIIHKNEW